MPTPIPSRRCSKCNQLKVLATGFYKNKNGVAGYMAHCKDCQYALYSKPGLKRYIKKAGWGWNKRNLAQYNGIEYTIDLSELPRPTHCPYLGIPLHYDGGPKHANTASLDRIDPSKGYIHGNVQIISDLANRMKQNATKDQLITFARSVLKIHSDDRPLVRRPHPKPTRR